MESIRWHLPFSPPTIQRKLSLEMPVLSLGSCFASALAERWSLLGLPITANPLGIQFNPMSLARQLETYSKGEIEDRQFFHEGLYKHYDTHGSLNRSSAEEHHDTLRKAVSLGKEALNNAEILILTFGTAWVFERAENGNVVANCHKMPAHHFRRRLAEIEEMYIALKEHLAQWLSAGAGNRKIILSVSPVRHVRDGLIENNRAKARLLELCHRLAEESHQTHYFPAYEYLVDVLRDHRFYKPDLVHPSDQSVQYILTEFMQAFYNEQSLETWTKIKAWWQLKEHRPLTTNDEKLKSHELKISKMRTELIDQYPFLKLPY